MKRVIDTIEDNINKLKSSSTKLNSFFFVKFSIKQNEKIKNNESIYYYFVKQRQLDVDYIAIIVKNNIIRLGNNRFNDILTITSDKHISAIIENILKMSITLMETFGEKYFIADVSDVRDYSFTFLQDKEDRFDENAFDEYCKINGISVNKNINTIYTLTSANTIYVVDKIYDILTNTPLYKRIDILFKLKNPNWTKFDPEDKKILTASYELYPLYHPVMIDDCNKSGFAYVMVKLTKSKDSNTLGICKIHDFKTVLTNCIDDLYSSSKKSFNVDKLQMKVELDLKEL